MTYRSMVATSWETDTSRDSAILVMFSKEGFLSPRSIPPT